MNVEKLNRNDKDTYAYLLWPLANIVRLSLPPVVPNFSRDGVQQFAFVPWADDTINRIRRTNHAAAPYDLPSPLAQ